MLVHSGRCRLTWLSSVCLLLNLGCAAVPYQYGKFHADDDVRPVVQIEYGQPNKTLDRIGWVVGLPARILPLSSKINNHQISTETTEKITAYLEKNDVTDVFVSVNQYAPKDEWRRLRENQRIAPGWKYTAGTLSVVGYTIFPGRIFGGDRYNPFTNSLHINSDVPAVALEEAAYAKDVRARNYPGTYAAINQLPIFSLWHHTRAVGDVLGYTRAENDWETEKQAYHVLFAHIGAQSASEAGPFMVPSSSLLVSPVLGLGGAVVGHGVGRTMAARRAEEIEAAEPADDGVQLTGYTEEQQPDSKVPRLLPDGEDSNLER